MTTSLQELIKTCETAYLEKVAEYDKIKEVYAKTQFDLLNAQEAAFNAFKKWSSAKEHLLVALVNERNTTQTVSTKVEE
jgi:hypothetical protein